MCKITFSELRSTEVPMPEVLDFEVWFKSVFGIRDVEAREVLTHYVSSLAPVAGITEHLLSLLEGNGVVYDSSMDQSGVIVVDGMLFVPASTIIKSIVRAKGIYSSGDVLFKQQVENHHQDIRINGRMTAASLICRKSACIVQALDVKGNVCCEGDLIAKQYVQCGGQLETLSHFQADKIYVAKAALMQGGVDVGNVISIAEAFTHSGTLQVSNSVAVGDLAN